MRVLVGGGTGFIGTALIHLLKARGHEVTLVSRKPGPGRITWDELATSGLPSCDAAVNLAGENILNPLRRWNEAFQKEVLSSRLETTQLLARAITKAPQPPQAWVLVTGVAYYQPSLTAEYDEDSPGGDFDFFSNLVTRWEAAARLPGDSTRQVVVRSGVVLGRGGGAIGHMLLPFRLGLGGPIGSGQQFFPWIHIGDLHHRASCLWARACHHAAGGPEGDPTADTGHWLPVFLPRAGACTEGSHSLSEKVHGRDHGLALNRGFPGRD
ncbi:short chain dehydrogenase/reductase family 39U member 1 [Phyllostomus discolor]|uniref:Short chain dehydrogenase/reductase family 39U member 1 n=1 Tax=Phyllostomus discolor TaxID=89673 RepID=A0A834BPN9_9CHIR|nr:short chain dehydrogenase/reductase family 39U member 1 [Phyllostomus discolor]